MNRMKKISNFNKKAFIISFYDILAIIILIIVMIFWMMVLRPPARSESYDVQNQIQYLDDDDNLITILKTPLENGTVLEYIKQNKDSKVLEDSIDKIIQETFGPACWELFVDEKSFLKVKCKNILDNELMDSEVTVPYDESKIMKIKLIVPGYT